MELGVLVPCQSFFLGADMCYALVYGIGVWSTARFDISTCTSIVTCLFSHQTVACGGVLPFACAFALGEYIAGGLLELESTCFSIGYVLLFALS